MRIHTGQKPYSCTFPGCDYRSCRSGDLQTHATTHTPEGQIRRKKQENRVNEALKKWGYAADVETTINAANQNCLADTQRYYSRLDFRIVNCTSATLILEVDEEQHSWYNLSCEFSRMSDVRASLVKAGYELPIYWIRYNPNGKYRVGSKQVEIPTKERELALKEHLERLCDIAFVPNNEVNIHYMYYDLVSEQSGPEIMCDPDFPEAYKECTSWQHPSGS